MKRTNGWIVGAVAAMIGCSVVGAHAQGSMTMAPGTIDYSTLIKPKFDYTTLQQAKAAGYSASDVATMAKIAHKSGWSLSEVLHKVQAGSTFVALAEDANLSVEDAYKNDDEQMEIANYKAAYEATGYGAMKMHHSMMPMSSTPMASTSTSYTTDTNSMVSSSTADTSMSDKDIATIISNKRDLSTLNKALMSADLTATLQGPGPFTLFAPSNKAFRKLPKSTVDNLMANPDQLKKVLTYHVIPARVDAATAMAMTSPTSPATVEGGTLQVTTNAGSVMINDATVTKADIIASNGIIHVIDTVLMPSDLSTAPMSNTMNNITPTTPTSPTPDVTVTPGAGGTNATGSGVPGNGMAPTTTP